MQVVSRGILLALKGSNEMLLGVTQRVLLLLFMGKSWGMLLGGSRGMLLIGSGTVLLRDSMSVLLMGSGGCC